MYLNTQTLQRCTERDIRAAFPNTSFAEPFQPPEGYVWVFPAPQPAHDPITQAVRETTPVLTDKGHCEQTWEVVPRFVDYTDDEGVLHTAAEQEAAAIATHQAEQAAATLASFDAALTAHLDATAQARRYDNRITCALRAGYAGPFQAEGQAFATWMDACNWQAYQVLAGVQSGTLTMPTVAEFISDLPEMVWPT